MKRIGILIALITIFVLTFYVIFPENLGERTPIWDVKERFFGTEYGELRSEYFISMNMKKIWYDQSDIFHIWNDHDVFRITEVYLKVKEDIADNCKITTSGSIEWKRYDLHMLICADALTDMPLSVSKGFDEYSLDREDESILKFESETGISADEILDTVAFIRSEYRVALNKLSEIEYKKTCARIKKAMMSVIAVWGIYGVIWGIVRAAEKKYRKEIDESMKDFI